MGFESVVQDSGEQSQYQIPNATVPEVSEPKEGNVPKGQMCTNHPWRDAYAKCAYCGQYFCYPDLVRYEGKEYCLEDLGKAPIPKSRFKVGPNRFTYIAAILFIASSLFILYHTYPQVNSIISQAERVGIYSFLLQLNLSTEINLINLFVVAGGIISGIVVLRNSGAGLAFAVIVIFIAIALFVFEYIGTVNTGAPNYYIYIIVLLILDTIFTILSRIVFVESSYQRRDLSRADWPKVETF